MNPKTVQKVDETKSSVPAEELTELGSVSEDTQGHTLGHFYDGDRGLWG